MKASIFKVKYFSNTNSSITIEHVRFANYYTQFPTITASYKILYLLLSPALLVTNYRISIHARRISIFFTPRRSLDDWRTTIKAAPSIQQDLEVSRNDRRARLVSAIHDTQATLFAGYIAGRYCVVKSSTTKLIVGLECTATTIPPILTSTHFDDAVRRSTRHCEIFDIPFGRQFESFAGESSSTVSGPVGGAPATLFKQWDLQYFNLRLFTSAFTTRQAPILLVLVSRKIHSPVRFTVRCKTARTPVKYACASSLLYACVTIPAVTIYEVCKSCMQYSQKRSVKVARCLFTTSGNDGATTLALL